MDTEEILKKVANKFKKNGGNLFLYDLIRNTAKRLNQYDGNGENTFDRKDVWWILRGYILSHQFAKAFWGEKSQTHSGYEIVSAKRGKFQVDRRTIKYREVYMDTWQYHLQQMVLSDDPILYLEQFLEK